MNFIKVFILGVVFFFFVISFSISLNVFYKDVL